ncbi:MAG TPA: FadR/GntR family transcriptional regulator [Bryobacteraceae bacterium]|nr:FadR/GntR family transcriptional regulator [Bryobacteraceae bacterium]
MADSGEVVVPASPKDDLTNQLIASFKNLIARGVLLPGSKLPAERDLAHRFGVSRSSLRHALKVLDILGVVRQRVGDGTYLSTSASQILTEPLEFLVLLDGISLFELLETRLIVEPELAARAAERATADHLAALYDSLEAMAAGVNVEKPDPRVLVETDIAFHQAIFRASGNRLCGHFFTLIHRAMARSIEVTSQMVDWGHTLTFHRPIYEAIFERQAEEAHDRMLVHLLDAREVLVQAAGTPRIRPDMAYAIQPIRRGRQAIGT